MKVIVLGSGIIGTVSAYFLAKAGCNVTVLEQNSAPARGCSFANGGQLSYSHIESWAAKASLYSMIKSYCLPHSYLSANDAFSKEFMKWFFEFYLNSFDKKAKNNAASINELAKYSKISMEEIIRSENIHFDYKQTGTLHFYRKKRSHDKAIKRLKFEETLGINFEILDKEQVIKKEPTLNRLYDDKSLAGGIFYPDDASGNSYKFASELAKICQEKYNVKFVYNCKIKNILTNFKKITGVNTEQEVFTGDAYVYALGALGDDLLKGINVKSKLYPLKGYSLSINVNEPEFKAPNMALTDPENRIVYSRLGNIFRAAGTVEISGLNEFKNKKHINFIRDNITSTFADAGDLSRISEWYGFRPFRPSSVPMICKIKKYPNLFLNTGHGSLGWTLSAGSGRAVTDLIVESKT
ncbi:MAG: FAD-dependent oxidoreductase [Rickettsiales bacterium]|nr:FAD-dependent oxidoreductase [Rickettsiales bacterium]